MKLRIPALCAVIVAAGAGCTPSEVDTWLTWWHDEPQAAEDYANQEWVQRSLTWGCDSYCDVDDPELQQPSSDSSDSSSASDSSDESDSDVPDDQYPTLGGSCSEWSDDALAVGWSIDQWSTLSYIMARESGCNPGAYNASGASGLLQIMPMWADDCGGGDLFDPWFNLSCGLHVYQVQGWNAWSTY